jgi:hypothetical protein
MEEVLIEVTDQELETAFDVYVQNFTGKEFLVRHILVSTENEALSALKRVKEGETFGRVASAISIDPAQIIKVENWDGCSLSCLIRSSPMALPLYHPGRSLPHP